MYTIIIDIFIFLSLFSNDVNESQGKWIMVYREVYGKKDASEYELLVIGSNYIMKQGGKIISTGKTVINPLINPKTIDLIGDNGRLLKGIYELHGDFYIVAYSKDDIKRPVDFSSKNNRINIWKRMR